MNFRQIIPALLTTLFTVAACSFGSSTRQAEETPVELETYQPSVAITSADNAESGEGSDVNPDPENATSQSQEDPQASSSAASVPVASDENQSILIADRGSYNGEIEPVETVSIVAEVGGMILKMPIEVGDRIFAGQELVRIDSSALEGQHAQAVAGLKAAQAQLDQLLAAADADSITAAEAAVNAAAVAYQEARKGPSEEDIRIAEAQVRQAEAAVRVAQAAFNEVKGNPKIGMMPQSQQLEQATLALEAAQAQRQKVINGSPADALARAYANLVQAQTQLANLQEGAKPEQIRAAEAQVEQAEAALYLSTLQVTKASVSAPMDGIVLSKNATVGSMAAPGAPLLELMSLDVNITIPVEENRMAQLTIGQPATVQVNAYPDRFFEGKIIRIAPQLDPNTRTVEVIIRPSNDDEKLLVPGMFASVDLLN